MLLHSEFSPIRPHHYCQSSAATPALDLGNHRIKLYISSNIAAFRSRLSRASLRSRPCEQLYPTSTISRLTTPTGYTHLRPNQSLRGNLSNPDRSQSIKEPDLPLHVLDQPRYILTLADRTPVPIPRTCRLHATHTRSQGSWPGKTAPRICLMP